MSVDRSDPDQITWENMTFIDQVFETVTPKPFWIACSVGDVQGFALVMSPPDSEEFAGVTETGQTILIHESPMLVCLTIRTHELHKIEFLSPKEFLHDNTKDG